MTSPQNMTCPHCHARNQNCPVCLGFGEVELGGLQIRRWTEACRLMRENLCLPFGRAWATAKENIV